MPLFLPLSFSLLVVLAGLTWWIPRRLGLIGMFGLHLLVVVAFFMMECIAIEIGIVGYEPELTVLTILSAFAFNCLLLPVALIAVWRRGRSART